MIGFSYVPASAIASGVFVEQENTRGNLGALLIPQKIALFGQYNAGKAPTAYTPRLLNSADEAAVLYGTGSMLHLMARKAFLGARSVPIYAFPIPDAAGGAAAQATITASGSATSFGTIALFIANQKVSIPVTLGDVAADIASAISTAVAAAVNLPVTVSVNAAVVTLTAKWKGETGNAITVKLDLDSGDLQSEPAGVSLAISPMSGGTTDPDTSGAFTALGATHFTQIAFPYASSGALTALDAAWRARQLPDVKKMFIAMIGDVQLQAAYQSAVEARNSPAETYINVEASPNLPLEIAASAVGACAASAEAGPAQPWKNLVLHGIRSAGRPAWEYSQHNATQRLGGGTTDPNLDGTVKIHDLVTTYKTNALGAEDDAFRYPETMANIQAKTYSLDNLFSAPPFDRAVVVDDSTVTGLGYVISPKRAKGFVIQLIDELWVPYALSKNRAEIVKSIVTEIDAGNPGRINIQLTDVLSAGLRIAAVKYNWTFSVA